MIDRAAALLQAGGVVAFPTETVYGLGANAFDARAVARIFEVKRRPFFDPLIVHVYDDAMLARIASNVSPLARELIGAFWPGPLTIVFPKTAEVPGIVTAGLPTVAARMPAHPIARELLARTNLPLAAPSANPFGYLSPTRAQHVEAMLGDRVDLIVDGGPAEHGLESTIVALDPVPTLLRPGAITAEAIEAIAGPLLRPSSEEATPLSPGRLPSHYAPRTPIRILDPASVPASERAGAGALCFSAPLEGYDRCEVLSPSGDLREAAARLFEALFSLDASGVVRIDAQPVPERGIGVAIADRLHRAAHR